MSRPRPFWWRRWVAGSPAASDTSLDELLRAGKELESQYANIDQTAAPVAKYAEQLKAWAESVEQWAIDAGPAADPAQISSVREQARESIKQIQPGGAIHNVLEQASSVRQQTRELVVQLENMREIFKDASVELSQLRQRMTTVFGTSIVLLGLVLQAGSWLNGRNTFVTVAYALALVFLALSFLVALLGLNPYPVPSAWMLRIGHYVRVARLFAWQVGLIILVAAFLLASFVVSLAGRSSQVLPSPSAQVTASRSP